MRAVLLLASLSSVFAADPIIGSVTVRPTFAAPNTTTQVTITALIADTNLSPNGANLQRLNAAGVATAVVGTLHDDGLDGDAVAGDRIFTLRFNLNEPAATGRAFFRASAAFPTSTQRVVSSSVAIDIGSAATPLAIAAATAPAPNAAGWNRQDVTVTYACAGGAGGSATCPAITRIATEGTAQAITAAATDGAQNTVSTTVTLNIDKTSPVIAITSPLNGATRSTASVLVTGMVNDATSGVASFTCNGQTVAISGSAFSCNLPLVPGSNAITVQAADLAGNVAVSTLAVVFSASTLTISAVTSPAANAAGWNNTNTTVSFTCAGGVAPVSCPAAAVISTEGGNQVITRTATDTAGSTATAAVTLRLDKTAPAITVTNPATAAATVTSAAFTLQGRFVETLSGIAVVRCNGVAAVVAVPNFTCPLTLAAGLNTIAVQATDIAGNSASSTVAITLGSGITISATPTPAPNPAGWNNTNVTVNFACAGGSGTVTCPPPVIVSTEGANQVISRNATDKAGGMATGSVTLKIDKSAPVLSITSPNPGATVINSRINIAATVSDALSGLASATCNGAPATLASANLTCSVTLVAGLNTIIVQALDVAGNAASTSLPVTYSTSLLTITATPTPAPNAAGWNNTNVTVNFTCGGGSGAITCPQPVTTATEAANQVVSRTATDTAGNSATASVTLKIDRTAPVLTIASPPAGSTIATAQVTVTGTTTDSLSGIARLTCNGATGTVTGANFSCTIAAVNSILVTATDLAGNASTSTLNLITGSATPPPTVTFTAPVNLSYLNLSPTTVSGTVSDPAATVSINGISAPVSSGRFSVQVPLAEGPNILTATATVGSLTGTASITVNLDTTPPHVTITTPPDKFVTMESSITVAGTVNDIVVGTVNDQQAQVTVNGASAQVANRTFLVSTVALTMGDNVIQAVARDRSGNAATTQITVTRQVPALSQIRPLSGGNQTAVIGAALATPLVVSVTDAAGAPAANKQVIFKVTQNNGMVSAAGGAPAATVIATTNAQGQAQAQWTLGMRAGAGGNTVEAYSVGIAGTVIFSATGTQGVAGKIVVDSGDAQVGAVNQPLPKPFIAVVVDPGNNRLAGVPVTFTVKQGGGSFAGQSSFTTTTDSDGRAAASLTLGLQEGNANNVIEANFASNQGYPAGFTASGRSPGDPAKTSISGVVLDNSNTPIPGVTIRAVLTNVMNSNGTAVQSVASVATNAQGQFSITPAPVGFVKLLVDGSTASRSGKYPSLDYDMVTVAGQNSTVGQPIYLLPLNTANQLCVTPTTGGGTLTIPEAPGFSLTFGPGQVTFPGGSKAGCVSVTVVHGDKVPMVPGFGQQPRFIVTIQPAGAVFNPPAPITLPNVDGLVARQVTEMYSFDHDIGSFVAIGTGTVSDDAQIIRSNQGVGVLKAGWHCGGDPDARGTVANCGVCNICSGTSAASAICVIDDLQQPRQNSTGDCLREVCLSGRVLTLEDPNETWAANSLAQVQYCATRSLQCVVADGLAQGAAQWAIDRTRQGLFGPPSSAECLLNDGAADAARHAYWNCLMTEVLGDDFAKGLGYAHELADSSSTCGSHLMDLFNNAVGRALATQAGTCEDKVIAAFRSRALRVLRTCP